MKNKELLEYITSWLAYYNHRKMFDGIVPMNTARLMVESSIDDELRKQARDLVEHVTPIIQKAERERIIGLLLDPDWKLLCEDNDGACSGCKGFYQALKEGGKEAE